MALTVRLLTSNDPWFQEVVSREHRRFATLIRTYFPENIPELISRQYGFGVTIEETIFALPPVPVEFTLDEARRILAHDTVLMDVYGIDHNHDHTDAKALVLTRYGEYVGHVYQINDYADTTGIIGIRKSLRELANPTIRGFAFILLSALQQYTQKVTHTTTIMLNAPFENMVELSSKYGFEYNEELGASIMNTWVSPLVPVPVYTLVL